MADLSDRQARLEARIRFALAWLRQTRRAYLRSPNSWREGDRDAAQASLDRLLEEYSSLQLEKAAEAVITPGWTY